MSTTQLLPAIERLYWLRVFGEGEMMSTVCRRLPGLVFYGAIAARVWAGGGGLNVVVVVNQNSSNSVQLGNYYCEQRQVPPQNLLRTSWAGGNSVWQKSDFESVILNPLLSMLSARQLTNQIDYVLLSMDFPYRVTDTNGVNSTTTTLFNGFIPDIPWPQWPSCSLPDASFQLLRRQRVPVPLCGPGKPQDQFLNRHVDLQQSCPGQARH